MLLEVLPADVDVFHQTLASVCPPLLNGVLGAQSEHGHVLEGQAEATQTPVELLGKTLSHLVALVLEKGWEEESEDARGDDGKVAVAGRFSR